MFYYLRILKILFRKECWKCPKMELAALELFPVELSALELAEMESSGHAQLSIEDCESVQCLNLNFVDFEWAT